MQASRNSSAQLWVRSTDRSILVDKKPDIKHGVISSTDLELDIPAYTPMAYCRWSAPEKNEFGNQPDPVWGDQIWLVTGYLRQRENEDKLADDAQDSRMMSAQEVAASEIAKKRVTSFDKLEVAIVSGGGVVAALGGIAMFWTTMF